MQEEILDARPGADLRVYAVFFEMVADDRGAKSRVDPKELIDDPRVTIFWDDSRVSGRWFDENVTRLGAREGKRDRIEWDAFILYGREAAWGEKPPHPLSWGRPVVNEAARLGTDLDGALTPRR
ncbi:MAG: hypothetical protein ACRD3V_32085 [Vicinamibacteria bacterium]